MLHKQVIITTHKSHVKIIIPWNETLVTDSTQQGSCNDVIPDAMLPAHFINGIQQHYTPKLELSQIIVIRLARHHISVS